MGSDFECNSLKQMGFKLQNDNVLAIILHLFATYVTIGTISFVLVLWGDYR